MRRGFILAFLPFLLGGCNGCDDDTDPPPPFPAPSGLTAAALPSSSSRIDLAWTDNTTTEDGFKVERSLDGVAFTVIATLPPNTQAYTDTGLFPSTTYYYRVKAFNAAVETPVSNTASATTTAVSWSLITPTNPSPSARLFHTAVFDPGGNRMIVYGGADIAGFPPEIHSLTFPAATWATLPSATPSPAGRYWHTSVFDDSIVGNPRVLVYGGDDTNLLFNTEVHSYDFAQWGTLAVGATKPVPRFAHSAVYDPTNKKMIIFAGNDGMNRLNDVWELRLTGVGSPAWTQLFPLGTPPSARDSHTAVFDVSNQRMIVFGGSDGVPRNDTWTLSLSGSPRWSPLAPIGVPPAARVGASGVYDPAGNKMVVFGGDNGALTNYLLNDVWMLTLSATATWKAVPIPAPLPAPRMGHSVVHDIVSQRMIIFAGGDFNLGTADNEIWALGPLN